MSTKFELKVGEIGNLSWLINQVSGTLADWKEAQKLENKILLSLKESGSLKKDAKGEYERDVVVKTVDLSDDDVKLLQATLVNVIAKSEEENKEYNEIKHIIAIDELLNGKADDGEEKK